MAIKNQTLTVQYTAWDTANNVGKTGDVANHTLKVITDGVAATPAASPSEVDAINCPGVYKVALSASEMNGNSISLAGKSSTANIIIIPIHVTTERGLVDAAITTRSSASVCTEARLAELDAANLPANVDTLLSRISATVATALTKIADVAIAGTETAGSLLRLFYDRVTGAVALDSTVAKEATLLRTLGLTLENHVEDDIVRDGNGLKTSSKMYLYDSKANATTHDKVTGLLAKYTMTATYTDSKLTLFKVVKD